MVKSIVIMMSTNVMTEMEKITEKLGGLEQTCIAAKEMTEIGLKDIEKSFATEHDYIREKLGHVLDDVHGVKNL
eukprot:13205686-Heterocapsa_arctica.AAC.1